MCRLAAITASEYFSPMEAILALETMKEGHDGSGLGITLKDLGGELEELKNYPILSGICSIVYLARSSWPWHMCRPEMAVKNGRS